jgi:zinc and cadmium transporter
MSLLVWIVLFTLLGGVLSVLAAGFFLLLPERTRTRALQPMVSFAIGALLGAALLAILPHALQAPGVHDPHVITGTVLLGLLVFFLLEKLVLWRHCHVDECEAHGGAAVATGTTPEATEAHGSANVSYEDAAMPRAHDAQKRFAKGGTPEVTEMPAAHSRPAAAGYLIVIGDGVHNFVDGVLIAAAFFTDLHLGIVTAIAVAAHEIPQEVGDFAVLLHSGFSRGKALFFNIVSSLTTVIGGILAYFSFQLAQAALPYVLAIAASSFIYIAVADLIPGLHKRPEPRATLQQVLLIAAGISFIYVAHIFLD